MTSRPKATSTAGNHVASVALSASQRLRPFRFATMFSRGRSAEHWREVARRAESLGYDVLLMPDHITDQLAPVPALAAAAAATTTLRLGSFVLDHDYRAPVMRAEVATTLVLLSHRPREFRAR